MKIKLTNGGVVLVDAEDFGWLNQYNWWRDPKYVVRVSGGETIWMHREINKTPQHLQTDHINGNPLDNRRSNLRSVTAAQNQYNQRPQRGRSSRYKGVGWHKEKRKWRAYIKKMGVDKHLGYFVAEADAAKRYNEEAKNLFGSFAKLNEI